MAYSETIEIITKMRDEATGKLKNFQKVLKQINQSTGVVTETTKRVNDETGRMNTVMKKTTRGMKFFQFEWLSVMFLGMAINRVFGQYVKGAFEMLGITELFTEALKLTVFTALEPFLEGIYSAIGWFFDLSEGTQKLIGWFIIFMTVFSGLMMWLGILKLGFGGVSMLGGIFGAIVKGVGSAFAWMGGIGTGVMSALGVGILGLIAIIAAIVVVIIGIVIAWRENFMNMKQIVTDFLDSLKMMFGGFFDIIKGIVKFFVAIFKGDFEGAKNAVIQIFTGLKNFIVGAFLALLNFIAIIGIGIIRVFMGVVTTIKEAFEWLFEKVKGIFGDIWEYAKGIWDKILSLFSTPITQIINVVTKSTGSTKKKQYGGLVSASSPYMVGEAGPELFVPRTSGSIVPNNKLGGSGIIFSPVYNINVSDKREFENMIKINNTRMVDDLRRLVQD